MKKPEGGFIEAELIKRINRFVAFVNLNGDVIKVYVPNTGRMAELAIPGSLVVMVPSGGVYPYKIVFIYYKGYPVMIDSIFSNHLAAGLMEEGMIDGLDTYRISSMEPAYGRHRFDILVRNGNGQEYFIELKSCTLAWKDVSAFPDAVSARASKHVEMLAESGRGIVVFLIMHRGVKFFVPNYHTDYDFYMSLRNNRDRIDIRAYSLDFGDDYKIKDVQKVSVIIPEALPMGSYLVIFKNDKDRCIDTGGLGKIVYRAGYYAYAGNGGANIFKRIARHRQMQKSRHWHIDYIKTEMKIIADIPVLSTDIDECILAAGMRGLNGIPVDRFGSSDCSCRSHLIYFETSPLEMREFWDYIFEKRYGQYQDEGINLNVL